MIFGRIVCFFKGHKRGKRIGFSFGHQPVSTNFRHFQCPRCGRETRYKVKSENHGAPGDEA
jgi:predicted RNA-binding Zn-ribbon protein involved in translation (DUF1610 family)